MDVSCILMILLTVVSGIGQKMLDLKLICRWLYVTFQMAEVLVSKSLFYEILERIKRLKPVPNGYD